MVSEDINLLDIKKVYILGWSALCDSCSHITQGDTGLTNEK